MPPPQNNFRLFRAVGAAAKAGRTFIRTTAKDADESAGPPAAGGPAGRRRAAAYAAALRRPLRPTLSADSDVCPHMPQFIYPVSPFFDTARPFLLMLWTKKSSHTFLQALIKASENPVYARLFLFSLVSSGIMLVWKGCNANRYIIRTWNTILSPANAIIRKTKAFLDMIFLHRNNIIYLGSGFSTDRLPSVWIFVCINKLMGVVKGRRSPSALFILSKQLGCPFPL